MSTVSKEVVIRNKLGLHARPAMQFGDLANQFTSRISIHKAGPEPAEVDGKSVMSMLMLEAIEGTVLRIDADGADADEALEKLAELVEGRFGEEE